MDVWGVVGCQQRRAQITAWLKEAYHTLTWEELWIAGRRLITEPWFRIADPFGSIVDEAIRRSESPQSARATGTAPDGSVAPATSQGTPVSMVAATPRDAGTL